VVDIPDIVSLELREALRQQGFAVVPIEPPEEMLKHVDSDDDGDWANEFIYKAMVYWTLGLEYHWRSNTTEPLPPPRR
jgi:hypothetical protein